MKYGRVRAASGGTVTEKRASPRLSIFQALPSEASSDTASTFTVSGLWFRRVAWTAKDWPGNPDGKCRRGWRERSQGALRAVRHHRGLEGKPQRLRQGVFELLLFHAQFEKDVGLAGLRQVAGADAADERARGTEAAGQRWRDRLRAVGPILAGGLVRPAGRFPPVRS